LTRKKVNHWDVKNDTSKEIALTSKKTSPPEPDPLEKSGRVLSLERYKTDFEIFVYHEYLLLKDRTYSPDCA
jgi:hypothetical protein